LLEQDYPKELTQIIVVDAGSTDGSQEIVGRLGAPSLTQFVKPGISEAAGQAFAVQNSHSDVIMFTNSDVYVTRSWITMHVRWLQEGYGLVGGRVFWGGDKFGLTWNMPKPKSPKFVQEQGLGLGFSNCSTTRELFVRVGGLRGLSSQHDTEFAFRVIKGGGKMILDPEIEVYHDHPFLSFKKSFVRSMGYAINHVLVMRAVYGRIVAGSGQPAMLPVWSLIKESVGITGVVVYKERRNRAFSMGIRISLPEFVFIRLFSTKLGQMAGVLIGATRRKVTFKSIVDLHKPATGPG
jgi:glycosyltransferase involved in cell wall biosynthesis